MPTTRSRKRTGSTSSDSGLPHSLPSPRGGGNGTTALHEEHNFDLDGEMASLSLDTTLLTCCNPRGCILGPIEQPPSPSQEVVRMVCSNDKCPCSRYMHAECFEGFEEQILSCLRGMSRARNWSEKQRKQNLWTKKGYDLVFKFCTCHCGKGTLRKDLNHVPLPEAKPTFPTSSCASSSSVTIASDKLKKKQRKKSSSLSLDRPSLQHCTATTTACSVTSSSCTSGSLMSTRRKSRCNSDSLSSDNGLNYMQPFAHRTDYSIFDRLLPRHLVNGYHIKMEDDGYAAGDEIRSFVLSSLAFHHTNTVSCVLCDEILSVYDRYPLIDGTFFLSPVRTRESSLEVESKGDDPLYMSAVCISCMIGINSIKCSMCYKPWNGSCHQIGTLYTYDLFAATPCCPGSVNCNKCSRPLLDLTKLSISFTQLSSLYDCPHCSSSDHHFLKPIDSRFRVIKRPTV